MVCRSCGIEIADKALICYRCGTPTTDAKFKAFVPPRKSRAPLAIGALILLLLVLLAIFLLHSPSL